ncbi:MAG: diguanylate cyclase [Atopobiaceae bacterium]|jgi:diguanylate cyclase (GGDEF)-like protein|nr:diguanylate cyclase [Atopobiaceae bacterium]MCI2172685.1 diguanylate cyclase [Atopobiaceae bacterium]MCI2206992.1 diguanylate cyclase [Atopobiaceae bacterium]
MAPDPDKTMTDEQIASALFEYMRQLIYNPDKADIDASRFPDGFSDVAKGLTFIRDCALEQREFAHEIIVGKLDATPPTIENGLASGLKEVQSALLHAAWQAGEVAKGDYEQSMDYMGDFGSAFNTMVSQLKDREEALERDKRLLEQANADLESTYELTLDVSLGSERSLIFLDAETQEVLWKSDTVKKLEASSPRTMESVLEALRYCPSEVADQTVKWEHDFQVLDEKDSRDIVHLAITSRMVRWNGHRAVSHVMSDNTTEYRERLRMNDLANKDMLTGLYNRRYGMLRATSLMEDGRAFCLAFIDIDHLKYCNDSFGHSAGDDYILSISRRLGVFGDTAIACRVGGDEFMLIVPDADKDEVEGRLAAMREGMRDDELPEGYRYFHSFSFGVVDVPAGCTTKLADLLSQADSLMYRYKFKNKHLLAIDGSTDEAPDSRL